MMSKEAYMALYEKCNAGQCSLEELRLLETYRDAFELTDLPWDEAAMGHQERTRRRIRKWLEKEIRSSGAQKSKYPFYMWSRYVAAAVVLVATVIIFGLHRHFIPAKKVAESPVAIQPGGNRAMLTLDDGSQIALDLANIGEITDRGNVHVTKLRDGQLAYSYQGATPSVPENNIYHTISTPRGGQYQVSLSDGTKVWLNAASSIRFPATFTGHERVVEIIGEAYLEVEKQPGKPFIVKGNDQRITVLGTRFNVMAYPDEHQVQTALLQGHVLVRIGQKDYPLQPGQRTTFDKRKERVRVEAFDAEEAIAWRSGHFMFKDEPVESVMRKIARWYDVEIAYEGNMEGKLFSGTISRYDQVQDVLDMLALTGTVNFKIEGRRIIVME
ncbi:FecR family protein [Parapedobacter tibetensis]|uniref:FecR family protein n=1 Tax=Parapedobacter tibetensis TaxID=2972951 RepID=UPI00214D70D9|nr:FecR domain-containing protein [Parapedobacter tibetensis]